MFAAQNVITYHWIGNQITNVLSTIIDHYSGDLNIKSGKKEFWKNLIPVIFLTSKNIKWRAFKNAGI